jgi:N utilization substance protein B
MLHKHDVRQLALQILYAWDASQDADAQSARCIVEGTSASAESRTASIEMARDTWAQREMIDPRLERLSPQWPPHRQPIIDRNILRLAVWELTNGNTPANVIINEAVELAKEFSTKDSPAFVNGVLDAVVKEHKEQIRMTNDE